METTIPLVDLKAQYATIQPEVDAAIARVLAHTGFIGGKEVKDFEAAFAAYQQTTRCIGIASGTAALFIVLRALNIGGYVGGSTSDEIITTPHTFIATVEAIEAAGARAVFVDIDPATFNLDPDQIEAAITPNTRAIMPVHLYGQLAPMDRIMEIAQRHNLRVIEDAAQAHGAEYQGQRAGAWGDAACFSFYPGKNLGAYGDGGAICTNNTDLADRIAKLRDHGRTSKYEHDVVGYGERLDALQAAVLSAKLPHLDGWNDARRHHAAHYDALLAGMNGVCTPLHMANARHVYHIYCISVAGDRDAILKRLNERGIGAGVHYPVPLHLQPALTHLGYQRGNFPRTESAANSILSLPIYPEMTPDQLNTIAETLAECLA
ncbi:MAG: DegT/DnrJ/EryC1/StrS family aminotransferase [Chloroflexota bacterium]|nr:DegT/DnrJ/EryC1/StrS family aminotransferase [Chloroflexota bacterium]